MFAYESPFPDITFGGTPPSTGSDGSSQDGHPLFPFAATTNSFLPFLLAPLQARLPRTQIPEYLPPDRESLQDGEPPEDDAPERDVPPGPDVPPELDDPPEPEHLSQPGDEHGGPQALAPAKTLNLDYVQALPYDKRIALLAILTHSDFRECLTFRSQVAFIRDALKQYRQVDLTQRDLAGALSCHHHSIQRQLQRIDGTVRANGRPKLLPPEAYQMIIDEVQQHYRAQEPVTIDHLLEEIEQKFDVCLSPDKLWHIIQRMPEIKVIQGIPMDQERIRVNKEAIKDSVERLMREINTVPWEFVVNMDESGCADFVDTRKEKAVVPVEGSKISISIPSDRREKRATIATCRGDVGVYPGEVHACAPGKRFHKKKAFQRMDQGHFDPVHRTATTRFRM
jgi:transposase